MSLRVKSPEKPHPPIRTEELAQAMLTNELTVIVMSATFKNSTVCGGPDE